MRSPSRSPPRSPTSRSSGHASPSAQRAAYGPLAGVKIDTGANASPVAEQIKVALKKNYLI